MQNLRPILLVEDGRVDVMGVERAVKDLKITNRLVHHGLKGGSVYGLSLLQV